MTNCKITISQDSYCENPRKEWDYLPTLFIFGGRDYGKNVYGTSLEDLISAKNLTSKKSKLLKAMDIDNDKYRKEGISDSTERALQYYIKQIEDDEVLNEVLNIIGYKTYSWTSRGYSQGDAVDCILVACDKFIKDTGIKAKDIDESLRETRKVFDARAWGDVYSIYIDEIIPLYRADGTLSGEVEEESIECCGNIYGRDELENQYSYVSRCVTQEQFDDALENIQYGFLQYI